MQFLSFKNVSFLTDFLDLIAAADWEDRIPVKIVHVIFQNDIDKIGSASRMN